MDHIALFGSSGFLGSHLTKKLKGNIQPVKIRGDEWENHLPTEADIFINCIGKAHDHKGTATEQEFFYTNSEIVKELFSEFLRSGAGLFIHISSLAVVEENERAEVITEVSECKPESFYGKSKKAGEDFLLKQKLPSDKKLVILRPSMIHGEGDKGNLTLLYKLISKGVPYPLGAFDNFRTFVSVDNVVFLINKIIEHKESIESGIYNIADDEPISTSNLIRIMGEVNQRNPKIISVPKVLVNGLAKIGDLAKLPFNSKRLSKMTTTLLVSNQKIKTALNIEKLPLSAENGLRKTIESFKNKKK